MCGICGIWFTHPVNNAGQMIQAMTGSLRHRGPDDEGYLLVDTHTGSWQDYSGADSIPGLSFPRIELAGSPASLALGFRRLAIIDLASTGHQPQSIQDGQVWIVYNGEIYNYIELKAELQALGHTFHTESDTEVILAAYQQWGEACLGRFNGMWALAIWDAPRQRLFCARDRFGIKPFYYFRDESRMAFASEIKALLLLPGVPHQPDDAAIYDYLSANMLDHTTGTFFAGIQQLPPAHYLVYQRGDLIIQRYWALVTDRSNGPISPDEQLLQEFGELFQDSIRLHLRSDVTVGTCLSGGLDSSSIVMTVNRFLAGANSTETLSSPRQKTFSACFDDPRYDERRFIKPVLALSGAEGHFTYPQAGQLLEELPAVIAHQDEPFGSLSIYAQWRVMDLARQEGIKVLLDGQGADEILAGYHSYFDAFWFGLLKTGQISRLGNEIRQYHAKFGSSLLSSAMRSLRPAAPAWLMSMARRYKRGAGLGRHVLGLNAEFARQYEHRQLDRLPLTRSPLQAALYESLVRTSLPKLLHYEDRNSMAHSIEARVPFLDYRLVELAFQLPDHLKIDQAVTKVALRQVMQSVLPEEVRQRRDKMGFVTPEKDWLAGPLLPWAQEITHSASFLQRPYFNSGDIQNALLAHASGEMDLTALAWRWLNLELWLRQVVERR